MINHLEGNYIKHMQLSFQQTSDKIWSLQDCAHVFVWRSLYIISGENHSILYSGMSNVNTYDPESQVFNKRQHMYLPNQYMDSSESIYGFAYQMLSLNYKAFASIIFSQYLNLEITTAKILTWNSRHPREGIMIHICYTVTNEVSSSKLTHCGLVMPYGIRHLGQHWFNAFCLTAPSHYLHQCWLIIT